MRLSVIAATIAMLGIGSAHAATIKVFADGPLKPALEKIGAAFERNTSNKVQLIFAPSPVIQRRIAGGEAADVLIIQPSLIAALAKDGKVTGEHPVFTRVGFALGARAELKQQIDVSTAEALKQTLLQADLLVCTNRASGDHFMKVLDRLGIADAVKAKVVRLEPAEVFARVLKEPGNAIAVGTATQIKATSGLKLIGSLPGDLQNYIPYAVATTASSQSAETASAFATFVQSDAAKTEFHTAGGE
jgi:molybdate transport system substrate-binding protein